MPIASVSDKIEHVQQERKLFVYNACKGRKESEKIQSWEHLLKHLDNILVDDKHKVLYCTVPKLGCTTWKMKLMEMASNKNLSGKWVHTPGALKK